MSAGCKDDNGGKGPIDEGDGGGNPDGSVADGGGDGSMVNNNPDGSTQPDGSGPDGSMNNGDDGSTPDGALPDGGNPGGGDDGGNGDAGGGDAGSGLPGISSVAAVEFGLQPCGGDAPTAKMFSLVNSGTTDITYNVALSSTQAFSIAGATNGSKAGTIPAGTDASITINAIKVPDSATAGQKITASLTVTTNLPSPLNSFVIPVSIEPQGAHLQLSPEGGANWQTVQNNQQATNQNLTLQNTGNVQATVTVTQPTASVFSLLDGQTEAASITVPAATSTAPGAKVLVGTFLPNIIKSYQSAATLDVAGPVCNGGGASIESIPFSGNSTGTGFTVVATTPMSPRVNCGVANADRPKATITVGNYNPATMLAMVTLDKAGASPYELGANQDALSIPPGETRSVDVTLKAGQAPSTATPGDVLNDSVTITPAAQLNLSALSVPLTTTVQGAVLTVSTVAAFTGANNQTTARQTLTVSNSGNVPASPTFTITKANPADPGTFTQVGDLDPSAVPAAAGAVSGEADLLLDFRPAVNDVNPRSATIQLVKGVNDVVCGTIPGPVTLNGTPSTPGFNYVTVGPVEFGTAGKVSCPLATGPGAGLPFTAPATKDVTFENNGDLPLNWAASITSNSQLSLFNIAPAMGTVAPHAQQTITITPAAIPFPPDLTSNAYGGVLSIMTTNIPNDTAPHDIAITQSADGAKITTNRTAFDFGPINILYASDLSDIVTISNIGTIAADVTFTGTLTSSSSMGPEYTIDVANATKAMPSAVVTKNLDPTLAPVTLQGVFDPVFGNYNDMEDLVQSSVLGTWSVTGPVCDVLPADISITGTGTNAVLGISGGGTPIHFPTTGTHHCGAARAAEPKSVILTNYGNLPVDVTSLALSDATWFDVYITTPGNGVGSVPPVNNGTPGTLVIVVAPKFVPPAAPGGPTLSTSLTINTSIAGTIGNLAVTLEEDIDC